jgi:protein-tyrosine phosphatase
MFSVAEGLFVGNSHDGEKVNVDAILNVARDLHNSRGWPTVEYAQVGLADGPGNHLTLYHAAVMTLHEMTRRHARVLVHCHEGRSRSLAVAMMLLNVWADFGWDGWMERLRERVDFELKEPHSAHREAFDALQWKLLRDICK